MKKLSFLVFAVLILVGFVACEKTNTDTVAVTVTTPIEGQELDNNDILLIKVTFTDPTELHNYSVKVMNETDSVTVFQMSGHSHATSFTIDTSVVVNATVHSEFMLEAEVSNHSGAMAHKHVGFHVHP